MPGARVDGLGGDFVVEQLRAMVVAFQDPERMVAG